MAVNPLIDRLKLLSPEEAAVLYWTCQGESPDEIATPGKTNRNKAKSRVNQSESTVRNNLREALATLRPFKYETPEERLRVRKAIQLMAGNPPRFDPWPPEVIEDLVTVEVESEQTEPQEAEGVKGEVVEETETPDGSGPIVTPTGTPARPQRNLRSFLLGIIILFAAGLLYSILRNLPETTDTPTQIAEATILPVATETPTTPEPTTIEATGVVDIAAVTQPPTISVANMTATGLAIIAQTEGAFTDTPSPIPTETFTPRPTITPSPTPLFHTDFGGIEAQFSSIDGDNYAIIDGSLITRGRFFATVDGTEWTNYTVSFNIPKLINSAFGSGFEIQVRRQNDIDYMALQIETVEPLMFGGRCDFRWVMVVDGVETAVQGGGANVGGPNSGAQCQGRWQIYLEDNVYSVFKEGDRYNRIIDGTYTNGGVAIVINSDQVETEMEEFKVDVLP